MREDWREDRGWEEKEGGRTEMENQQTDETLQNLSLCLDYVGDISSKPFSLLLISLP